MLTREKGVGQSQILWPTPVVLVGRTRANTTIVGNRTQIKGQSQTNTLWCLFGFTMNYSQPDIHHNTLCCGVRAAYLKWEWDWPLKGQSQSNKNNTNTNGVGVLLVKKEGVGHLQWPTPSQVVVVRDMLGEHDLHTITSD